MRDLDRAKDLGDLVQQPDLARAYLGAAPFVDALDPLDRRGRQHDHRRVRKDRGSFECNVVKANRIGFDVGHLGGGARLFAVDYEADEDQRLGFAQAPVLKNLVYRLELAAFVWRKLWSCVD